jgi:hypothetical protein
VYRNSVWKGESIGKLAVLSSTSPGTQSLYHANCETEEHGLVTYKNNILFFRHIGHNENLGYISL